LGRKGGPFLPNLPLLRHKVAGGVAIMRIAGVAPAGLAVPGDFAVVFPAERTDR